MPDPRVQEYARLLVERSIDVQPGWQVLVISQPPARPLLEEVVRLIARRGAYPLVRFSYDMEQLPFVTRWSEEAPLELLDKPAPADQHVWDTIDAWMLLGAPENTRAGADIPSERRCRLPRATPATRDPLGDLPLPLPRTGAGCRPGPEGFRGLHLRRRPPRLGHRGREDEADRRQVRSGDRGAHCRRRDG